MCTQFKIFIRSFPHLSLFKQRIEASEHPGGMALRSMKERERDYSRPMTPFTMGVINSTTGLPTLSRDRKRVSRQKTLTTSLFRLYRRTLNFNGTPSLAAVWRNSLVPFSLFPRDVDERRSSAGNNFFNRFRFRSRLTRYTALIDLKARDAAADKKGTFQHCN